jgi:hypothetical protein
MVEGLGTVNRGVLAVGNVPDYQQLNGVPWVQNLV